MNRNKLIDALIDRKQSHLESLSLPDFEAYASRWFADDLRISDGEDREHVTQAILDDYSDLIDDESVEKLSERLNETIA